LLRSSSERLGDRSPKQARLTAAQLAREGDAPSDELTALLGDRATVVLNVAATAAAVLVLMIRQPGG
jgi:hypothetical protein